MQAPPKFCMPILNEPVGVAHAVAMFVLQVLGRQTEAEAVVVEMEMETVVWVTVFVRVAVAVTLQFVSSSTDETQVHELTGASGDQVESGSSRSRGCAGSGSRGHLRKVSKKHLDPYVVPAYL